MSPRSHSLRARWNGPRERHADRCARRQLVRCRAFARRQSRRSARFYKVGSEFFTRAGPEIVAELRARQCDVFLDLKFHDIPNTVAHAVSAAADMGVAITTVHASGGIAMLRAAAKAATPELSCPGCVGSHVARWFRGGEGMGERPAGSGRGGATAGTLAADAGIRGLVCSGMEAKRLRGELGPA